MHEKGGNNRIIFSTNQNVTFLLHNCETFHWKTISIVKFQAKMPTVLPQLDASYTSVCNNVADAKAYSMKNLQLKERFEIFEV